MLKKFQIAQDAEWLQTFPPVLLRFGLRWQERQEERTATVRYRGKGRELLSLKNV